MFKSIRWRFIIIFLVLVLIAIVISGVYIVQFFEQYNEAIVDKRLDALSELMLSDLTSLDNLIDDSEKVEKIVDSQKGLGFREEIFVIVNDTIIATSTNNRDIPASSAVDQSLIVSGLSGDIKKQIELLPVESSTLRVLDKVFPIKKQNENIMGVLYLRYDLKDTDDMINRSKTIIVQSIIIALSITMLLGFIIAKNITVPINEITQKAYKMARGDFDQYVEVKSDDEIGKLAEMFNHLTRRLKLSLNEISKEKSKLEVIVNNIDDGLIAVTKFREIIHINPKAVKILTDNDIIIASNYDDMATKLPVALHYNAIVKKYPDWKGSEIVSFKKEIYRARIEPFENEVGENAGFIIVFQDITESQRLDNMRKDFVANVSHELKTPLTSIKSYSETLLGGAVDDPQVANQFLNVINTEADRMSRLVRELLQLSNFDANRTHLDIEENDWCKLLTSVVDKMSVHIKNRHHQVDLKLPVKTLFSAFDYDRMEQVVVNLLSNAIKYTPNGGKIDFALQVEADDIIVRIKDSGVGIDRQHLPQLFERFYRVDKGRSRELGGTGLGLSIAKEIVELHGGNIYIESKLEKGTTVWFKLPKLYA